MTQKYAQNRAAFSRAHAERHAVIKGLFAALFVRSSQDDTTACQAA